MTMRYKRMAIQVNKSSITVHEKIPEFPCCTESCLVVSVETVLKILIYFPDELWNYMTIFHDNRCYNLKSLLCYLLKNKVYNFCPYFCCSFLPMHFWEEDGVGEFALF